MEKIYERKKEESYEDYCVRLYRNQVAYNLKNDVIGFLINDAFPEHKKDESAHRKNTKKFIEGYDKGYAKALSEMETEPTINGLKTLMPKSHLEKFSELVGEYDIRKRDMQLERNELASMMRKVTPWLLLTEQYREALQSGEIEFPEFDFDQAEYTGETIIKALPSDWHIGALVNEEYNQFNFDIATRRVDLYCTKIIETARRESASTISITNLGDIIEGLEMRSSQKWECEFLLKDQLKYAEALFLRMIMILSKNHNVIVGAVYGNHDRLVGDKNKAIGKDNAMAVIFDNIKSKIEFAEEFAGKKMERVTFADIHEELKYQTEEIFGTTMRWQHGHEDAKNDERKHEKYNGVDNADYNILGFGHLHHGRVIRKNRDNIEIYTGGLMGANEYSKYRPKSVADASQCIVIFRENGDIEPIEINLQNA